jgi:hypothetical protein
MSSELNKMQKEKDRKQEYINFTTMIMQKAEAFSKVD